MTETPKPAPQKTVEETWFNSSGILLPEETGGVAFHGPATPDSKKE